MHLLLKQARLQAGYDISDIAKQLRIKECYLIALEDNNLSLIPAKVYADGYLKLYSTYLGIDTKRIVYNDTVHNDTRQNVTTASSRLLKYCVIASIVMTFITMFLYDILSNNSASTKAEVTSVITPVAD